MSALVGELRESRQGGRKKREGWRAKSFFGWRGGWDGGEIQMQKKTRHKKNRGKKGLLLFAEMCSVRETEPADSRGAQHVKDLCSLVYRKLEAWPVNQKVDFL